MCAGRKRLKPESSSTRARCATKKKRRSVAANEGKEHGLVPVAKAITNKEQQQQQRNPTQATRNVDNKENKNLRQS